MLKIVYISDSRKFIILSDGNGSTLKVNGLTLRNKNDDKAGQLFSDKPLPKKWEVGMEFPGVKLSDTIVAKAPNGKDVYEVVLA